MVCDAGPVGTPVRKGQRGRTIAVGECSAHTEGKMTLDLLIGEVMKCTNCQKRRVIWYAYEWAGMVNALCKDCNECRQAG